MRRIIRATATLALLTLGTACSGGSGESSGTSAPASGSAASASGTSASATTGGASAAPFQITEVAAYDEPWAMTFLPGTPYAAITQRGGQLIVRDMEAGTDLDVDNEPEVAAGGQGGLGDIIAAPSYEQDQRIYLSWVEPGDNGTRGAVVGNGRLVIDDVSARIENLNVIWRQVPKVEGEGHFGHRLAMSPDGTYLFVSSGERQQFDPAQDPGTNLGKILRLNPDGFPAQGNPLSDQEYPSDEIWSWGHRNPLGLAFDAAGNLWESEMGPKGGDEINLIRAGANYGWPKASNGSHYSGEDIPDHAEGDGYEAPKVFWNPSISPGGLMIYSGSAFPEWVGDAFVPALSGQSLIRVDIDGTSATAADQWSDGPLGERLREVEQGPDGTIWVLQDGGGGKLLHLTPPA
ncbi:PQQ-dependent sugar dehydrogenase [Nostocoides australiense]